MKVKDLAALDSEYAKELESYAKAEGVALEQLLEMTLDEFLVFCEAKVEEIRQRLKRHLNERGYTV